ncbi:hypothetical protein K435DRAFT_851830 [Dendrothele bispora CBS 962.96]|uniref:Uncharacterized protein n=1 Tax=Dendrothele bispora (strain CBS 962.96) TaxID=1314807 RepID=A0A4S8ML28_DENBC|nr:hypothetical protein K435DRAFT_851830 [Dendrothele bispora CBS 962.96]
MVAVPPGEPKVSPKPEPIGNMPWVFLLTTCILCLLFILWRRADSLRSVISHQLKTITRRDGRIRLSEDDGPPAHEFLEDEHIDDALELGDGDVQNLPERVASNSPDTLLSAAENRENGVERELDELESPRVEDSHAHDRGH